MSLLLKMYKWYAFCYLVNLFGTLYSQSVGSDEGLRSLRLFQRPIRFNPCSSNVCSWFYFTTGRLVRIILICVYHLIRFDLRFIIINYLSIKRKASETFGGYPLWPWKARFNNIVVVNGFTRLKYPVVLTGNQTTSIVNIPPLFSVV